MPSPLSGKRLLLVGQDADLAALVAGAVSRLGAEVRAVPSGRGALAVLARRPPDVVVVDLPLADLRGGEVFDALARAGVPTLAISGVYRGARAAAEVRGLGAVDFFEKPFPVEVLAAAVARAAGAAAEPGVAEEARDDVTGAHPLRAEEMPQEISAAPVPALDADSLPARPGRGAFPARAPEVPSVRASEDVPPAPRGDLAEASVPRLLVAVHEGQATGALTVQRGPVRKILVFERGVPVYAASNVGAERLGAICVRRAVVAGDALEALRRDRPGARTAELLLEAGLLTPERRAELVAGQVRAIAWSTFEWRDGSYEFQLGRPPAGRVEIRIGMAELLLEGMLRASTLERLRAELSAGAHLAPAPDPAFELYALGLRPKEAHLLALADGTKSVDDLVRLSEMDAREALAFLHACRTMRVLDEVDRVLASTRRIGFM